MIQLFANIILTSIIYLLIIYSFRFNYSILKFLDLSHAIILVLASYSTFFVSIQLKVSLIFALLISIIFTTLIMLFVSQKIYKNKQKRYIESWQMLLVTLGLYTVLQNVLSIAWGDNTLSFRSWPVKVGHQIWGAFITDVQIITVVVCFGLLVLSWLFIEKTIIGKQIKAISSNPDLANVIGISKDKVVVQSFIYGSVLAACSGILIAADMDMTPTMGFNWLLYSIVAMIIGGMGKMRYLLLGSLLLSTAQHLSAYYLDSTWMNATTYIILIVFLYFRPYGFSGKSLKKAEI